MESDDLDPAVCAAFLVAAFILSGLCQAVWLGSKLSRRFAFPLDGGLTWRHRRLFGDHKTVRGFMAIVPATALSFALLSTVAGSHGITGLWPLSPAGYLLTGFWAGMGFMGGELPNSFLKRQMGIPPGARPESPSSAAITFLVDRLDSVVGMLLALGLVVSVPWRTWLYVLAAGPVLHGAFSVLVYRLGGKGRAA